MSVEIVTHNLTGETTEVRLGRLVATRGERIANGEGPARVHMRISGDPSQSGVLDVEVPQGDLRDFFRQVEKAFISPADIRIEDALCANSHGEAAAVVRAQKRLDAVILAQFVRACRAKGAETSQLEVFLDENRMVLATAETRYDLPVKGSIYESAAEILRGAPNIQLVTLAEAPAVPAEDASPEENAAYEKALRAYEKKLAEADRLIEAAL